jgi:hypothetical protein
MSRPGQSEAYRTSRLWGEGGYVTDWYDSRVSKLKQTTVYSLKNGLPSDYSYETTTLAQLGHFGFVKSYRGQTGHPRNMKCHAFESQRRSYDVVVGAMEYAWGNNVYQLRGLGAGNMFYKAYVTGNNLPYHDSSALVAKVESDLYIQASEPYVPPIHWLGEIRETILAMKRPLGSIRRLTTNFKQKLYRLLTSKKELEKRSKSIRDSLGEVNVLLSQRNGPKLSKSNIKNLKRKKRRLKRKIDEINDSRESLHKSLASAHLEYQFGVLPLIGMANSMAQKLADLNNEIRTELTVFKSSAEEVVRNDVEYFDYAGIKIKRETLHVVSVRGQMTVQYVGGKTLDLSRFSLTGLMQEVVTQLWQLVGLSFVVDWGIGIGKLLKESRPVLGHVVHSSITTKAKRTETVTIISSTNQYWSVVRPCGQRSTAVSTTRTLGTSRPGKLRWGSGIDSIGKGMSLLSLITGRISK